MCKTRIGLFLLIIIVFFVSHPTFYKFLLDNSNLFQDFFPQTIDDLISVLRLINSALISIYLYNTNNYKYTALLIIVGNCPK